MKNNAERLKFRNKILKERRLAAQARWRKLLPQPVQPEKVATPSVSE